MNDRELLELAARAAGIDYGWQHIFDDYEGCTADTWDWNPITNDGDALRLAVKLHLTVYQWNHEVCVCNKSGTVNESETDITDFYTATRKAIVKAAAQIGKEMR